MMTKLEKLRDWIQFILLVGSIIGSSYIFYNITDKRINRMEDRWEAQRKEDQERWKWLFDWAHKEIEGLKK